MGTESIASWVNRVAGENQNLRTALALHTEQLVQRTRAELKGDASVSSATTLGLIQRILNSHQKGEEASGLDMALAAEMQVEFPEKFRTPSPVFLVGL